MAGLVKGKVDWDGWVDDEGHRNYKLTVLVQTFYADGPQNAFLSSGLPTIGSPWQFGNDYDPYALCLPGMRARPVITKEPGNWWLIEQNFSTKPLSRCQTTSVENPLAEPQKKSGSFLRFLRKTEVDRHGDAILSSSHEPISVDKRDSYPVVRIEQNVANLQLATVAPMVNTLNDSTLWGLGARKILLADFHWEERWYGTCTPYYTRFFEFEVNYDGWDENELVDSGLKVLNGRWIRDEGGLEWVTYAFMDKDNPQHFIRWKDVNGEAMPRSLLDGEGQPLTDPTTPVILPTREVLGQSNFAILGIPTSL